MAMNQITIFTDGASRGNPGPGGWGLVAILPNEVIELGDANPNTTNNEMELLAILAALQLAAPYNLNSKIYTDSAFVVNGVRDWLPKWRDNSWLRKKNEEIKHLELWQEIDLSLNSKISLHHLSAHVGIAGNERADEIATNFADGRDPELFQGKLADYKIQNILDLDPGKTQKPSIKKAGPVYSYVSLLDGVIQTHKTWDECKARVHGINAKYKKVFSKEEEDKLVAKWSV